MTDDEIQKQIDAIRRVTAKACESKESALQFLIDAGIIEPKTNTMNKTKEEIQVLIDELNKRVLEIQLLKSQSINTQMRDALDTIRSNINIIIANVICNEDMDVLLQETYELANNSSSIALSNTQIKEQPKQIEYICPDCKGRGTMIGQFDKIKCKFCDGEGAIILSQTQPKEQEGERDIAIVEWFCKTDLIPNEYATLYKDMKTQEIFTPQQVAQQFREHQSKQK